MKTSATSGRAGISLLEVMIAVGILSIAMFAVIGNMMTIENGRKMLGDTERANMLMQLMVARINATGWSALGQQPLVRHRRATPRVGAAGVITYPPLTEKDLIDLGILTEFQKLRTTDDKSHFGINGLEVYVEYYRMGIYDSLNDRQDGGATPRDAWTSLVGNVFDKTPPPDTDLIAKDLALPEDIAEFKITDLVSGNGTRVPGGANTRDDGVVIRILVAWIPHGIDPRPGSNLKRHRMWREMVIGRRP